MNTVTAAEDEIDNVKFHSSTVAIPTIIPTATPESSSNKDVVLNLDVVAAAAAVNEIENTKIQSSTVCVLITTTSPVSCTENDSREERKEPKDVHSNLNGIVTANDYDDIDSAKLPPIGRIQLEI